MNRTYFLGKILAVCTLLFPYVVHACPEVQGLIDYNCDGKVKIVVTGDSEVRGVGDERNGGSGGYVLRLKRNFPGAIIKQVGKPGYTASRLLTHLKQEFLRGGRDARTLRQSDVIIIDIGRNGYFRDESPSLVARDIRRISDLLKSSVRKNKVKAFVVTATMFPTPRAFQAPYVREINDNLLAMNSPAFPVLLRLNRLPTSIISSDGIHPNSRGYNRVGRKVRRFLSNKLKNTLLQSRPDTDGDDIYDPFEQRLFSTDPDNPDTDGDGLTDGEEVFLTKTDPTVFDNHDPYALISAACRP